MNIILLIKIFAVVFILLLIACAYVIISNRREILAKQNKKKANDAQHTILSPEKELPEKYTRKQLKKIEKYEEKVDNLDKKNSELEKRVNELTNQIKVLRKDISVIQEQDKKNSQNSSVNSSPNSSSVAHKKKVNNGNSRPSTISYERLTVGGDGNLIHCEEGYPVYYRAWNERERIRFEFVNSDRTKKAINNRYTYIEPFCIKTEESKLPDESDFIETITPGILNDDYTVKEKAVIKYK